jgi:predicted metal-dependent peptidase
MVQGCKDFTFSRVSRREPSHPSLVSSTPFARKLKIRVKGDTSGSMGERDLSVIVAEMEGILKPYRDCVEYGSVDAQAYGHKKVTKRSQVIDLLRGGGGTDMRIPIDEVRKEKAATRPDILIIITDGETPWPETPLKGVQVIAVLTRDSSWRTDPPSWIKSIEVR